jgi:hypothetical protein
MASWSSDSQALLFSSGSAFKGSMLNGPVVVAATTNNDIARIGRDKNKEKKNYLLLVVLLAVLLATLLRAGVMCTNSYNYHK